MQQQPNPPDDLQALAEQQAAVLLALELQASAAASWQLAAAIDAVRRTLRGSGKQRAVQQLADVARQLDADTISGRIAEFATRAADLGVRNAAAQTGMRLLGATTAIPDPAAAAVAKAAPDTAAAHLDYAIKALRAADSPLAEHAALSAAARAPEALSTAAAFAVNRAANEAVRGEAARLGARTLWIAERDACVVCTALAGHTADPSVGEGFDEFATFGTHAPPAPWPPGMPLLAPPRHPHCRCQIVVWLGTAPGQPSLPAALIREAKRSILRGYSRPSESQATRVGAARRLLHSGAADMPKSVRAHAAEAVMRGRFTDRTVPVYRPHRRTAA